MRNKSLNKSFNAIKDQSFDVTNQTQTYTQINNSRPISANYKKIIHKKKLESQGSNTFILDTTNIFFHNIKSIPTIIDKEKVYQENLQLKTIINNLRNELNSARAEIHKKELELVKKGRELEEINNEIRTNVNSGGIFSNQRVQLKIQDSSIITNLKQQNKEITNELKSKISEIEVMKKNSKMSKISELTHELKFTMDEFKKVKELYELQLKKSQDFNKVISENLKYQDRHNKLHFDYINLNEKFKIIDEENQKNIVEIINLKNKLKEKNFEIKNLRKEIKNSSTMIEISQKNLLSDNSNINMKIRNFENTINDLQAKLNYYQNLCDEKDDLIKDLRITRNGTELKHDLSSNYFCFSLFKTLESQKVLKNEFINIVNNSINTNVNLSVQSITNKLILLLGIKNPQEISKLMNFISSHSSTNLENFRNKIISLYEPQNYTKHEEEILMQNMINALNGSKINLVNSFLQYDIDKTGFISYSNLKKILEFNKIELKPEVFNYMTYIMKSFILTEKTSIEDYNYNIINEILLKETNSTINKEEVAITEDEYNKRISVFLEKFLEILKKKNTTVRKFFDNNIFIHEIALDSVFEAILLNVFSSILEKNGLVLDNIDLFCVYTYFKYNEKFESIDMLKLINEMEKLGISSQSESEVKEKNLKISENDDQIWKNLERFLLVNNWKLDNLFSNLVQNINIQGQELSAIPLEVFYRTLYQCRVSVDNRFSNITLEKICDEKLEYIIFDRLKNGFNEKMKQFYPNKAQKEVEKSVLESNEINDIEKELDNYYDDFEFKDK